MYTKRIKLTAKWLKFVEHRGLSWPQIAQHKEIDQMCHIAIEFKFDKTVVKTKEELVS